MAVYLIPECNLAELETRIDKLNKRAKRLGISPITVSKKPDHTKARVSVLTVNGEINSRVWMDPAKIEEARKKWPHEDTGERMVWWAVEVVGESPSLPDWTFVAILEPMKTEDGEVLNLVSNLPGETCPAEYRDAVGRCDHCNMARRQCLKDFLGYHQDPHTLASWAESLAELACLCGSAEDDEWLGGNGYREARAWDLHHFLTLTACRIRLFGWLSKGRAYEEMRLSDATANQVLELLTPPHPTLGKDAVRDWEKFCEKHTVTDADAETANNAIEWAKDLQPGDNDYLYNINLIARVGSASRKTAGLAASVIVAYQKAMDLEIKRQQEAARPVSNHVGTVGERIKLVQVTCEKVHLTESMYGLTGVHKLVDASGNDITWFASGGEKIAAGETVWVSMTVKSHGDYKGRKQTVVSRVEVWTEEGVALHQEKERKKAERAAKKAAKEAAKA